MFLQNIFRGAQRAPEAIFERFEGPFESPLGGPFGHAGGAVALLGHLLGPKWRQKRQDEGLKSDLGSSRGGQGSQRLSMGRLWEDFQHLLCAIWYFGMFSVRKGWCILCYDGFVHFCCCFFKFITCCIPFRTCLLVARC